MTTDWETSFTDLQANDFGNLGINNSGNILVGNHVVIFTETNSPRIFSVGNVCVGNGTPRYLSTPWERFHLLFCWFPCLRCGFFLSLSKSMKHQMVRHHNSGPFLLAWLACRSSSVNFFDFGEEIWWEIWREFCRIFSEPQNKGSKISGKISERFS